MLTLLTRFHDAKVAFVAYTGLAKDALHVYFGLLLYLAVRLMIRGRRGAVVAWLTVLFMAAAGEWLDHANIARFGVTAADPEHWHDIWNTLFWPTVLMLLGWGPQRPASEPAGSGSECRDQPFE